MGTWKGINDGLLSVNTQQGWWMDEWVGMGMGGRGAFARVCAGVCVCACVFRGCGLLGHGQGLSGCFSCHCDAPGMHAGLLIWLERCVLHVQWGGGFRVGAEVLAWGLEKRRTGAIVSAHDLAMAKVGDFIRGHPARCACTASANDWKMTGANTQRPGDVCLFG